MTGPYETEQQVRELPAVRAIYDAMYAGRRHGVMGELGYRLLDEACEAASVKVGAYDHRILIWLTGFEPEACAVIAGLITRAHQAETPVTGEHPVMLTAAQAAVRPPGFRRRRGLPPPAHRGVVRRLRILAGRGVARITWTTSTPPTPTGTSPPGSPASGRNHPREA
jgi:hypothetical protein